MIDEIVACNVDHVTITINMVDPRSAKKIYPWIFWDHRRVTGREASRILSSASCWAWSMLAARACW